MGQMARKAVALWAAAVCAATADEERSVVAQGRALQETQGCQADDRRWLSPNGELNCHDVSVAPELCSIAGAAESCREACCGYQDGGRGDGPAGGRDDGHGAVDAHRTEEPKDMFRMSACEPVVCGEDAALRNLMRGTGTSLEFDEERGCMPHVIYNHVTKRNETIHMKCRDCVPRLCAKGEHDCVPVYCNATDGEGQTDEEQFEESNVDPCLGGHHDDDGLAWWPFLLVGLVVTVAVTTILQKLNNGACCGKSINPPFTVVMFFFGYYISHLCVEATHADDHGHSGHVDEHHGLSGILFKSVLAWKAAHPHVILFVLLPPLLFEDASGMDYYVFRKVLMSSIILAGPGVFISMLLTAGTTMLLFGFAEECVVESDTVTGALMVGGARENTFMDGDQLCDPAVNTDCLQACEPLVNPRWQSQQGPDGGLICVECVEGSWVSPQLPVSVHLLLGGMLAATDPVAVCAVLRSWLPGEAQLYDCRRIATQRRNSCGGLHGDAERRKWL